MYIQTKTHIHKHLESQWSFDWLHIYMVYSFHLYMLNFSFQSIYEKKIIWYWRERTRGKTIKTHTHTSNPNSWLMPVCFVTDLFLLLMLVLFFFSFSLSLSLYFLEFHAITILQSEMECQNEWKTKWKIFYKFKYRRIPFPWILILTPFECLLFLFKVHFILAHMILCLKNM